MAFAPYHNGDHRHNPAAYPRLGGQFRLKENDNLFEYAVRAGHGDGQWAPENEYPHFVHVGPAGVLETRYARVLKTVAYVVVDENDDGKPVIEKWAIKQHQVYPEN